MGRLNGKVAVITAATSGMALATRRVFVDQGAYVFITGRRQDKLDDAVAAIGRGVTAVQGTPGTLPISTGYTRRFRGRKGKSTYYSPALVLAISRKIGDITEDHFDKTLALNVRGTLFTVRKALPLFTDGGSIILNGSIAGVKGFPNFSVYSASKADVRSFARTWLVDLKERKSRVNVLIPGTIDTPALDPLGADAKAAYASLVSRGEIGRPGEIATAALFLASDESSFVNGTELFVDGGTAQI